MKIKETIVVEGKYDKIRLSQLIDANIIQTDGFIIFKNKEMLSLLKRLAEKTGLIILTDSDRAGFMIRDYIKNCLSNYPIKHAFIPNIPGKEKRKEKPGKEGLLGVEGMRDDALLQALKQAEATSKEEKENKLTKADFYLLGLSGRKESKKKREKLAIQLGLPTRLSSNMLLDIINALYDRDKIIELL